jgi:cell wall-associated NlpC family hydrolase
MKSCFQRICFDVWIVPFVIAAMVICSGLVAHADGDLTISLEPSAGYAAAESNPGVQQETARTSASTQSQYVASVRKSKSSQTREVSIGRVGVVKSASARIRSVPSSRGPLLFSCPKETYLAVIGQSGGWYGVLMVDSSTGWVKKSDVTLLNYSARGVPMSDGGLGGSIVNAALKYLGIPYKWGGYSSGGLDCSGFVKAVFAAHGINLPRVAREQAGVGSAVNGKDLRPGDRLYFACKGGSVDHTGIYIGNGYFIHSSVGRRGVAVDSIYKPLFLNSLVTIRRS